MVFQYDDIITELDCVGDQLGLLCSVVGEFKDRNVGEKTMESLENAIHAVECHIHRISQALGEYTGNRKTQNRSNGAV